MSVGDAQKYNNKFGYTHHHELLITKLR